MKKLTKLFFEDLFLLLGWHTNRRFVVFESDDWGSIRMPSKSTFDYLLARGYPVNENHYSKYDSLETADDYIELFNVLSAVKDLVGNSAIFTANYVAANPDFEKIRLHQFKEYYHEGFPETYNHYSKCKNNLEIIKQGLNYNLLLPQSHGREHLNVPDWMAALKRKEKVAHIGFESNMFTIPQKINGRITNPNVDALYYNTNNAKDEVLSTVAEGLRLFKNQWGFFSKSFMAPGYIWNEEIEATLHAQGVDIIQGVTIQLKPSNREGIRYVKNYHFTGQKNKIRQTYIVRNSFFEPSENPYKDWVNTCLNDISRAFRFKKPAIIQSHRVNYIGSIDNANRTRNLFLLKKLLVEIIRKWPDVEFISSVQLGDVINATGKD